MMRVTEDTPPDQLAGRMSLQALLPNGEVVQVQTERSTPMMDLLIQVCTKVRLQPSGHVLQALGSSPDSPVLQCHPNTPIGTLDTQSLKVLPKSMLRTNTMGKDSLYDKNKAYGGKIANFAQRVGNFNNLLGGNRNKNSEGNREVVKTTTVKQNTAIPLRKKVLPSFGRNGNIPKSQPFQTTFRLTVNLPRNQLYVVRVSPAVMLDDILQMVCAEKGLNYTKYEFRHPDDIQQQLPLNVQLGALGLSELTLVNSVTSSTGEASHADSHSHSSDQSERVGLSSVNTHRLSRSHSALNTLHKEPAFQSQLSLSSQSSQETRRMDTPLGESPRLVPLTGDFPRPKPPARKRRPAPKPPLAINSATINEDDINYTDRDVITDLSQSTGKPDGVQQRMTYLVLSPSHSRSSSDSSGYHEPSVLSEGPSKTPPGTKTTVVAAPPRKKKAPAPPRPPQQQEPDSVKPPLRQSSIVDVTAEHTTVITNKILSPKAPPLPVSCAPTPNQPNPQAITVEASVDPPSNDAVFTPVEEQPFQTNIILTNTPLVQNRESVPTYPLIPKPKPRTRLLLQDNYSTTERSQFEPIVKPRTPKSMLFHGELERNLSSPILPKSPIYHNEYAGNEIIKPAKIKSGSTIHSSGLQNAFQNELRMKLGVNEHLMIDFDSEFDNDAKSSRGDNTLTLDSSVSETRDEYTYSQSEVSVDQKSALQNYFEIDLPDHTETPKDNNFASKILSTSGNVFSEIDKVVSDMDEMLSKMEEESDSSVVITKTSSNTLDTYSSFSSMSSASLNSAIGSISAGSSQKQKLQTCENDEIIRPLIGLDISKSRTTLFTTNQNSVEVFEQLNTTNSEVDGLEMVVISKGQLEIECLTEAKIEKQKLQTRSPATAPIEYDIDVDQLIVGNERLKDDKIASTPDIIKTNDGTSDENIKTNDGTSDDNIKTNDGTSDDNTKTNDGTSDDIIKTNDGTSDDNIKTNDGTSDDNIKTNDGTSDDNIKTNDGTSDGNIFFAPNSRDLALSSKLGAWGILSAETRHSRHRESVSSQSSLTSPKVSVSLHDGFVNLNSDSGTKEVRPKESEIIHTAGNQFDPIICPSPPPDWTYTLPAPPTPFADRAIVFTETVADGTAGRDTFTDRDSMVFFPSRSISHDNITLMSDNMTVVSDITTVSDPIITPVIKQIVSVGENLYRNGSDIDSERDDSTLVSVESSCFTDPNTDLDFDSGQVSLESLQKRQSRYVERELCNLKEPTGLDEADFVKNDIAHPGSKRTSTESRSSLMGELQELLKGGQSTQILQRSTSHVGISAKTANTLPNFKLTTYAKSSGINIFEDDTMRNGSNYEKKNTKLDNVFKKPLDSVVLRKNHNNTLNFNNNYIRNRHSDILRSESFNDTTALHLSNSITNMDTINKEINGFHEEETERRRSSVKRSVSHASLYDKNEGWDLQSLQVMRTILPKLSPPHSPEEDKEEPKMNTGVTMSEGLKHQRPLAGPVESSDADGQMKESMKDTTLNSIIKENRSRNEVGDNIQKEKYASVTNINMNVKETEPVLEEVKSKEIYCESENVRKPWTYTGPPGIKLSTWSERPKSLVSLKSDRDYKMGGLYTALTNRQSFPGNAELKSNYVGNAETKIANERNKEALTMRLISHAAPLKNQMPSVISPSSPKTQFKTIESNICTEVPKVQSDLTNLRESMHNDNVSRVPIVRAVELKKGFQLPTKDFHNINNSLTPPISGLNARTFFKSSESINVSNIDSNPVMRVASFKQPEARSFITSPVVKGFRFADSKIEDVNKNITLGAQDNVTLRKPITMSHIQSQSVPNSTPFSQNSLKRTGYKDRMFSCSDANTENNRLSLPAKLAPAKMQSESIRNVDTKMAPPPPQMPVVRGVKLKIPVITRQNTVENQRGQLLDSIRSFGKANLRKID